MERSRRTIPQSSLPANDNEIQTHEKHTLESSSLLETGLHMLAKMMSGSNLRGKVTVSLITFDCSEVVTFCSQTRPALGMLDLAGRKYTEEKGILCLRAFSPDHLSF